MKIASGDKAETVYVAKALHHANQAAALFETAIIEGNMKGTPKAFFQELARRSKQVVTLLTDKLKPGEALTTIRTEMKDQYWLDSMFTGMLALNAEGRTKLEDALAALLNGQDVEVK